MSEVKTLESRIIPLDQIKPLDENPRLMSDDEFNALCENVDRNGFNQPLCVWFNENTKMYELVKGHRRYDVLKYKGVKEIECKVAEYPSREEMLMDAMADNINVGHFDPIKMTELFKYLTDKGIDEKHIRQRMAITTDEQLKRLIKQFEADLPEHLANKLKAVRDEIKTVDDLSNILNQIFQENGDTLEWNFMVFSFGTKKHLYVKATKENWDAINKVKDIAAEQNVDINSIIADLFTGKKTIKDLGK